MLKTAVNDSLLDFWLQDHISKTCRVYSRVRSWLSCAVCLSVLVGIVKENVITDFFEVWKVNLGVLFVYHFGVSI